MADALLAAACLIYVFHHDSTKGTPCGKVAAGEYSFGELQDVVADAVIASKNFSYSRALLGSGAFWVVPRPPQPREQPVFRDECYVDPASDVKVTVNGTKCILLDIRECLPAAAPAAAAAAGSGGSDGQPAAKRAKVAFDVPPPGVVITVRDLEEKHKSVSVAVPDSWESLLERLRERCGYQDSHRLYYSTIELVPKKMKLASEDDFVAYASTLAAAGHLPDIWVLRASAAAVPSPDQLPASGSGEAAVGKSVASSGRSSAQQSDFRNAVMLRDGNDALCALCGSDSDLQAAHILPQKRKDNFTTEEGVLDVMKAAGLASLYDVRNGFLLCDQCHDFFDAYLWSVDGERHVVISDALKANVPKMGEYAGKQLFPDDPAAAPLAVLNRPLAGVWAWHLKTYGLAREARHAEVKDKFHFCDKCKKPYVQEWRMKKHQKTCTSAVVPAKHFFTPADKASSGGAGGGAAGGGSS